jgi:hypothetical protein
MRAGLTFLLLLGAGCATGPARATFADRPPAWHERDDDPLAVVPVPSSLGDEKVALFIRDFFTREADRRLALEQPHAAADVNALDEVPCSTWFCPRNHLHPMSPDEVAAGPPGAEPPQLPLTISSGKAQGVAPGFVARDARGRKYLIKLDPVGHAGLASGAEVVGSRLFHAAGYHVPGAFAIDVPEHDLLVRPDARIKLSAAAERPFTRERLLVLLQGGARTASGALRAVAVPWVDGKVLGAFDMFGRRADDSNDRIPHQDRRSLRASYLLAGWLNIEDASAINTLDSVVEEGGRRFVRHHFIDFGDALGSASVRVKGVFHGREHLLDLERVMLAAVSLGAYRRDWQRDADTWRAATGGPPDAGWMFPVDDWDPAAFRTGRKNPAHLRMTARDAYWGAKVVTSFTDAQLEALLAAAGYRGQAAATISRALRVRRDRIGARYLVAQTALENPVLAADGRSLCFDDLAVARGYLAPGAVRYRFAVGDAAGGELGRAERSTQGPRTCLPLPPLGSRAYVVVQVTTVTAAGDAAPARVHLRFRPQQAHHVVVGLERDEGAAS